MSNSILGKRVDFEMVLNNREMFLKRINVDIDKCACMWVTHGDEVVKVLEKSVGVSMKDSSKALSVDGLMANKKGVYLFQLDQVLVQGVYYWPVLMQNQLQESLQIGKGI